MRADISLAGFLSLGLLLAGCGHRVSPTERYSDPSSLPIPFDVSAAQIPGAVVVSWSPGGNVFELVDGWNVYRRPSMEGVGMRINPVLVTDLSFQDTDVEQGLTYFYTVRGVSPAGVESLPSHEIEILYDSVPPSIVTGLTATPEPNAVFLQWEPSPDSDVTSYRVYRDGSVLASLIAVPEYRDMPVSSDRSYLYQVTAVDARGNESDPSDGRLVRPLPAEDRTPPDPPSGLVAAKTPAGIRLTWSPVVVPDLWGYFVYRRLEGAADFERAPGSSLIENGESYEDVHAVHGATYDYAVTAIDTSGNESARSATATIVYVARVVNTGGNTLGSVYPWCAIVANSGRMQFLIPAAEIRRSGSIEALGLFLRDSPADRLAEYGNVTVELAHIGADMLTNDFASNRAAADGLVAVFGPATIHPVDAGEVFPLALPSTFLYDGERNLLVEISWNGDAGKTAIFGFADRPGAFRRLWQQPDGGATGTLEAKQQFLQLTFTD